jgi:hypothetical protein
VALPVARTNTEAHLFMDLNPCACGETAFERSSSVVPYEGGLASLYRGRCARCGEEREFVFGLPAEILIPSGREVVFGGDAPSQLLDAGEWLWVADRYARSVPAGAERLTGPDREQVRTRLATAAAALAEVLKFVPPGADAVPRAALWTDRGAAVYVAEPGRFAADRLKAVREVYRETLDRFDGPARNWPELPGLDEAATDPVTWPGAHRTDLPREVGGFRFARVVDGWAPDGTPVVSADRGFIANPNRRDRILKYLESAAPLYRDPPSIPEDLTDPQRDVGLRYGYWTDGEWIWPAAVGHYLDRYGVAPEPDFYRSMRMQAYYSRQVVRKTVWAARDALREWLALAGPES